jgi:hypothetical protein
MAQMDSQRRGSALVARARVAWRTVPLLPAILVAFPIIDLYLASGVSFLAIVRALTVAVVAALVVWALASAVLGDRAKGSLVTVLLILGLYIGPRVTVLAAAALLLLLVLAVAPRLLKVAFPWALVTPAGNALAVAILVVVSARAAQEGTLAQLPRDLAAASGVQRTTQPPEQSRDLPDIYVLMLEDYPRADTLDRVFGFDNRPFLEALEARGFTISEKSRSNYSNSQLTLLTMFQARHVEAIPELNALRNHESFQQYPLLRALTNEGRAFDVLRDAGYTVIAASSGFEQLAIRGADRFFDSGQLNDFEVAALRETALATVSDAIAPDLIGDQQRARIRADFAFLPEVAGEDTGRPRFVFVHVPSPHAPIVFGPGGEPIQATLADPYGYRLDDRERFRREYAGQLQYLNSLVLQTLDGLPAAGRPAVTIVMTDEGFGGVIDPDPEMAPVDSVAILFAARGVDGESLFPQSITPVNVFPILFGRYLDVELPRQPDRNFISGSVAPFDGKDIPNLDAQPGP